MSHYQDLLQRIKNKEADVSIIGMGYIGLPTALFYAMRGMKVRGIDTNHSLIETLKKGNIPIIEEGLGDIADEYLPKIKLTTSYDEV